MQATISGVTPKIRLYNTVDSHDFLEREEKNYNSFNKKSCLYSKDKSYITDQSLNYLNLIPENNLDLNLKNLILSEFNSCDKKYPYLGDYFLSLLFSKKRKSRKSFKFNKSHQKKLIDGIQDKNVANLGNWLFDNISMDRNIIVDDSGNYGDIIIEKVDDFVFSFEYDFDFYVNNPGMKVDNYKFVIIDGFLETVGEIHHLLEKANKTKEAYVVFCHGMSDEVKYNILQNNAQGRTQVLPVSINYNENTINVLNDLAVIHKSYVVSSNMGQTISQEIRKELDRGSRIVFYKDKLVIKSLADDKTINAHKKFLRRRLNDAEMKSDVNTDPIINRIKMFSSKSLKIYVPKDLALDRKFSRDLDYLVRTIQNFDKSMTIHSFSNKENYFIPVVFVKDVQNKVNSLKSILYNVNTVIVGVQNGNK